MFPKTAFATCLTLALLGASYFVFLFVSTYIKLEQYADSTGVERVFLSLATGFNALNLLMSFFLMCVAGLFYYLLKTYKA
jgi:uncharacterized BrkB/YihY/UPF0761 family membrane protein